MNNQGVNSNDITFGRNLGIRLCLPLSPAVVQLCLLVSPSGASHGRTLNPPLLLLPVCFPLAFREHLQWSSSVSGYAWDVCRVPGIPQIGSTTPGLGVLRKLSHLSHSHSLSLSLKYTVMCTNSETPEIETPQKLAENQGDDL